MVHIYELEDGNLFEEPASFMLVPRSSIFRTPLRQANNIGIIDSGYRGRIMVPVDNRSDGDYFIDAGQRLFQLVHPSSLIVLFDHIHYLYIIFQPSKRKMNIETVLQIFFYVKDQYS